MRNLIVGAMCLGIAGCWTPFGDFGDDGSSGFCDCTFQFDPCVEEHCEEDECVRTPIYGAPTAIQNPGDCQTLLCVGEDEPVTYADPSDGADDGNPCTIDSCSESGGVLHEPAPAGSTCGEDAVCSSTGVCVSCDEGDPCFTVDCTQGEPIIEQRPPGTSCGANSVCSGTGDCFECDDDNGCTTEECSTGSLVVTSTLPAGASCGTDAFCSGTGECFVCDDDNACTNEECSTGTLIVTATLPAGSSCGDESFCDATGACISCSDGNACTHDDCTSGTPVHTPEPYGTSCGNDGAFCDNSVCVTWCLPLPDPSNCQDTGVYEATDDDWNGEPQFADDDGAPRPICGVLTPGDVDWISYYAADRSFENDINDFMFWSFEQNLRVCSFASCSTGTTSAPCYDGGVPAVGPEGQPGCCWQGIFNTSSYFSMNLECAGTSEDSGWVRIRIDNPNNVACAPYALRDYGY